jgi:hypothetical protein
MSTNVGLGTTARSDNNIRAVGAAATVSVATAPLWSWPQPFGWRLICAGEEVA